MKKRLDNILVELGYFDSREKAKREILIGNISINDKIETKAGTQYDIDKIKSVVIKDRLKYVSRGGLKLEGAIKVFNIAFSNKIVLDIGASTGGFTDCALQNGAMKVYAVDVGTNQLAYSLRQDSRVISLEKTHIKDLDAKIIKDKIDIIVADVSFISITKIIDEIERLYEVCNIPLQMMLLIKPQFELQREYIGKNGIVEKQEYRDIAINKVKNKVKEVGYKIINIEKSPIKGTKGNEEYLMYLLKEE